MQCPKQALSQFIQIDTSKPEPKYHEAVDFLKQLCIAKFGNPIFTVREYIEGKPNLLVKITGNTPDTILLSCHMDVVPYEREKWTVDPFSGLIDGEWIWGRGAQDMKCQGIMYIEALSHLMLRGKPEKTFLLVFTVDEEIGSAAGMKALVENGAFEGMMIQFAIDEGCIVDANSVIVAKNERYVLDLKLTVRGKAGHASILLDDTAAVKLTRILSRIDAFRQKQRELVKTPVDNCCVLSVNVTMVHGGTQVNVIPAEFSVCVNMRIPPGHTLADVDAIIEDWISADQESTTVEWLNEIKPVDPDLVQDLDPHLVSINEILRSMNIDPIQTTMPGGTDSRFLRGAGIKALNITPVTECPSLQHDHDERINIAGFLRGIEIFERIFEAYSQIDV